MAPPHLPDGEPELVPPAELLRMRAALVEAPRATTRARHIAAAAAVARERSSTSAGRFASRTVRGAAAIVATLGITSGLAAAEVLPAPAQRIFSSVSERFSPPDAPPATAGDPTDLADPTSEASPSGGADAGAGGASGGPVGASDETTDAEVAVLPATTTTIVQDTTTTTSPLGPTTTTIPGPAGPGSPDDPADPGTDGPTDPGTTDGGSDDDGSVGTTEVPLDARPDHPHGSAGGSG